MDENWEKNIMQFLKENLSIETEKIGLYKEAFTHSSNSIPNNQRLAFLGDSKLNTIIREYYFLKYPEWNKGKLTQKCDIIESNENFASFADTLKVTKYMNFGKTYDNRPNDVEKIKIRAEVFEALFGAIYLDKGLSKVKEIILQIGIIK